MQYKFTKEQRDYSDFSSGRVFYSLPGYPAFPVRLASEVFQRCVAHRQAIYNVSTPCTLYDPCCGAAYHLSVLGYLHREHIRTILASDIDEKAVVLAGQNLGLLSMDGLDARIREITAMFERYGKESHRDALHSASVLRERLSAFTERQPLATRVFRASATDPGEISALVKPKSVDIVFTDVPYGQHASWKDANFGVFSTPLETMLGALLEVLSPSSMVAIVSDKRQKAVHQRFERIEHFQVGKRRVVILKPNLAQSHAQEKTNDKSDHR